MVEIGKAIVSLDLFKEYFTCDLNLCKGACCIEGDSGAPLTDEEAALLEDGYLAFKNYLQEEHSEEITKQGFSVIDSDGDRVTPLVQNRQCAYSFYDGEGILKCAVEKAWSEGKISFRKPVSCHLFPVRITEYRHFHAVNYQKIKICAPGRDCGLKRKIPLWQFLKEPLTRQYGEEWYQELALAARYIEEEK